MKTCTGCRDSKPPEAFWKNRNMSDGLQYYSKDCHRARTKDLRSNSQKNKEWRRRWLERQYGLTERDYNQLLAEQGGVCAICQQPETDTNKYGTVKMLAVDHDHETGVIRGLLCQECNTGIGSLKHDPALLLKAADYVNIRLRILSA